jgi:hypothetical protein
MGPESVFFLGPDRPLSKLPEGLGAPGRNENAMLLLLFLFVELPGEPGAERDRVEIAVHLLGIAAGPVASALLLDGLVGFKIVGAFVVVADKQLAPPGLRRRIPGFQSRAAMRAMPLFSILGHDELLLGMIDTLRSDKHWRALGKPACSFFPGR